VEDLKYGTFLATSVGKLEVTFPDFLSSKVSSFKPDIGKIFKNYAAPIYNVEIGIENLAKIGIILNFAEETITIDHVTLPMTPHDRFMDLKAPNFLYQGSLESNSMHTAAKCTVEILDAKYKTVDIVMYVTANCKHLSIRQQQQLVKLLLEFKIFFDETLCDWRIKPVSLNLKPGTKAYHGQEFPAL